MREQAMRRYQSILFTTLLVALVGFSSGCSGVIQQLRARDQLNKGVTAFRAAAFAQAVEHFKRAVELDPTFLNARLYLATAYMSQYVPGAESEENLRNAEAAQKGFLDVLERDPVNTLAVESLGSLAFNQKKLDDAKQWYEKLIKLDNTKKTAYYTIGVINWTRAWQPQVELSAKLGMRPEDPGPIKDRKAREELKSKNDMVVEEGIQMLQRALEIDPEYDDAMAYLNLMYRQKAYIAETPEENKQLISQADQWMQRALETRKKKTEGPVAQTS
jgi:tetratricopeptide (TPR) repeat protein